MTRKRVCNPDPSIHPHELRFAELSHGEQVAMAAWAVLFASEPPAEGEPFAMFPPRFRRAIGEVADTVSLRDRKQMNYLNPRQRRRTRRSATQKVTA